MELGDWLRKHLKPKRGDMGAGNGEEEEEEEEVGVDEEVLLDLIEFLHVIDFTSVEKLKEMDVESITYYSIDKVAWLPPYGFGV